MVGYSGTPLIRKFQSLTALALLVFAGVSCAAERGQPPQYEIPNFGRVSDQVYRGAQPGLAGIGNLKQLGVGLVINLRMPGELWAAEAREASANGIAYTNVPMQKPGWPADEQIRKVLSLIRNSPAPAFVHCHRGCDRTGTIIACYRIEHDHWSSADALREAKRFGMSWRRFGMKRYVKDFARKIGIGFSH